MTTNLPATENLPTTPPSQVTIPTAVSAEKSKKYKTLLAILGLLFILVSTPLAVYLVKQRQEIRKEAGTEDNPSCVIASDSSFALGEQAMINVTVTSPKEYVTKLIFVPPDGFYDPEDHAEEMLFNYNLSGNCSAITYNEGTCHGGSCGEECSTCDLQFTLSSGNVAGECLFFIKFASDDGSGSCQKTIQIVAPPTPTSSPIPSPTPTPTSSPTPSPSPTPTPTLTPSPSPTPTGAPTSTPTSPPSPTATPTTPPTPTPGALTCSLTSSPPPASLEIGDTVILTCTGQGDSIDYYDFQVSINNGNWQSLGQTSGQLDYTISNYGCYRFECRPCQGDLTSPNLENDCTSWP